MRVVLFGSCLLLSLIAGSSVLAAPGDLDPTFGDDGVVEMVEYIQDVAALPGGGLAVLVGGGGTYFVRRYTDAGTIDSGYGSGGQVALPTFGYKTPAMLVLSDGSVVVGGGGMDVVVVRITPGGTFDPTFGVGGVATIDVDGDEVGEAQYLGLQSDGGIVVAGHSVENQTDRLVVLRLTAGGTLDTTFAASGFFFLAGESIADLAVQGDDGIVMLSRWYAPVGAARGLRLRRLTPGGTLDTAFSPPGGNDVRPYLGPILYPSHVDVENGELFVLSDQKILVTSVVSQGPYDNVVIDPPGLLLTRYLPNGALDTSYGSSGITLVAKGHVHGGVALAPDDSLILGRWRYDFPSYDVMATRVRSDGALEPGFGTCGTVTPVLPGPQFVNAQTTRTILQDDGKIVLAAFSPSSSKLIRLENGTVDVSGEPDGDGIPDACDLCPDDFDPAQPNRDGDEFGDACDICTGVQDRIATRHATLTSTKLTAPYGDETLAVKGMVAVPTVPALNPVATGMRVFVGQYTYDESLGKFATTAIYLEVPIPPGAYDPVAKTGWKVNGKATAYTYKNAAGLSGITSLALKLFPKQPGVVQVQLKGKKMTLPLMRQVNPAVWIQLAGVNSDQCMQYQIPPCAEPDGEKWKCKTY